jgi:hypothetical protein
MACSIVGITNSIKAENKPAVRSAVKKALKTTMAERALATDNPLQLITSLIIQAKPTVDGKPIDVLGVTKDTSNKFHVKYRVKGTDDVINLPLGNASPFVNSRLKNFSINSNNLETFYSDYEYTSNNDDFEAMALDITNNPGKIVEVADSLVEADEYHNDQEFNPKLMNQLDNIQSVLKELVPNVNVHINNSGDRNTGKIDVSTGDIFISKGVGGSKSLLEIYVHELYHATTHYALSIVNTSNREITSRIEKVRDHFLKSTTESDLVRSSGGRLTEEQAAEVMDHLTDPEKGLHEFVALAMTNRGVMHRLSELNMTDKEVKENRSLLRALIDFTASLFSKIAQKVSGEPNDNDLSRMMFLVNRLHTAHKKPLRAKKFAALRNLISIFEPLEKKFSDRVEKFIEKNTKDVSRNVKKKGESDLKYNLRLFARSFYDDQASDIIGGISSLLSFKGGVFSSLSPEGTIRTIIRDATQSDLTQQQAEALGMLSGHIDQKREFIAAKQTETVLSYFSRKLTAAEEEMLTSMVLDTDISTVYDEHLVDIIGNDLDILNAIRKKEDALKDIVSSEELNFYKVQSDLLSNYMIEGTDNIGLLMNADNIAKMIGTGKDKETVNPRVVELIDQITTLKALKISSKKDKLAFKRLIEEDPVGVVNLVAFQKGQKDSAAAKIFPTKSDKLKIIKGYSAQMTDPDVSIISAPISRKKELESQGYKLDTVLNKHTEDNNSTPMGLFVNNKFMDTSFHRVGMRLTDKARRGVTVTESFMFGEDNHKYHKANLALMKLDKRRSSAIKSMFEGTYSVEDNSEDSLLSPTLNNLGEVSDYRYSMDKKTKMEYLDMERKVSVVMGRTAASTYDKEATDSYNAQMMELILEDARKNKKSKSILGKNLKEYIKIEKHSSNKDVASLWRVLPAAIKNEHRDGFYVRRDLMYTYLGFREMGVENVLGFDALNANSEFMKNFKYVIKFAEKLWQEIVKISKIDIIIRIPAVFFGNVISNFMLMYVSGYSFKEIIKLKYQGIKELRQYTEGFKEAIVLEAKKDAGIITKEDERRLNVINNNLLNSPVKDLVDAGFYTTIIEEMEHGGETGSYFNRLAKKKLKNVPKIFRDGIDILYITENTKLFKTIEKGIQASDFAARYAQYHLMVEQGVDKTKAITTVRDNFIDYNKPNSRFVEWANKNGFVMFTKYFTRIQRVIRNYGFRHPAKVMLALLGQNFVLGDIDDMTDQHVFVKDLSNLTYSPWGHLMRVITPSSLEAVSAATSGSLFNNSSDLKV